MHKYFKKIRTISFIISLISVLVFGVWTPVNAEETITILFDLNQAKTYVNDEEITLDTPAMVNDGQLFVPVRFLSDYLGFKTTWDSQTKNITVSSDKVEMELNQSTNLGIVNGKEAAMNSFATMKNGRLYFSARTISQYIGADIKYDPAQKTVRIMQQENNVQKVLEPENAKPIAQFTTDKSIYRVGEPIKYIDLSYDPDGNGLYLSWKGKQTTFFVPGEHQVTLVAKDSVGNIGKPYTRTIKVSNDILATEDEYGFYFGGIGNDSSLIKLDSERFAKYPMLDIDEERDTSRKLIVSNSPETIKEYGILYQDKVSGKFRLYGTHINGMQTMAQVYVMVTNPTDKPVQLLTTQKGSVVPTTIPELLGNQGIVDWHLQGTTLEQLTVKPNETIIYFQSEQLFPKQGTHFIFDGELDEDDELIFNVIGIAPNEDPYLLEQLNPLPKGRHIRGTFDVSNISWEIDASDLDGKPHRIEFGGGDDPWVTGKDGLTGEDTQNRGNYGVIYDIKIKDPEKAAITLVPRGGIFKGAILYNDTIISMPKSGIIRPKDAYLIDRTTGDEDEIHLVVSPPSGSFLPFDILLYPLDDRK